MNLSARLSGCLLVQLFSGKHSSSGRFKKSVSIGETINESDQLWKSTDSRGSNESLASNASIPLPIPVRTRSAVGGSESGYSSDYNALSIRRLERDTSVDRLSTGNLLLKSPKIFHSHTFIIH